MPRRVPALPAGARVAGSRRLAAALGAASVGVDDQPSSRRSARRDPPRAARRAALARRRARRRPPRVRGRARRALHAVAGIGARAQAAAVGDGRRARRDDAPARPHRRADPAALDRAARRAPRSSARTPSRAGSASAAPSWRPSARRSTACRSSAGARSPTGAIDPELSRSLFIQRALIEGDWDARHRFLADNRALLEEVEELEHRARRRDIVATEAQLYDFYDARIPADVVSGAHFDRWWKDARRRDPALLTFTRELLVGAAGIDRDALPDEWRQGDIALPLTYRFEPGSEMDGVTVNVPLAALAQLRSGRLRLARAGAARGARDRADPLAAQGPAPAARADPGDGGAGRRGAAAGRRARSSRRSRASSSACAACARRPGSSTSRGCPSHLRPRFEVRDEAGAAVAAGERPRGAARGGPAAAARAARRADRVGRAHGPARLDDRRRCRAASRCPATGDAVRAYPALVDEGDSVARAGAGDARLRRRPRCARARGGCWR